MVILQSYFKSYNYQQDKSTYYDCWITRQTALKIAASNLYCKITLVWLNSSLSVDLHSKFIRTRIIRRGPLIIVWKRGIFSNRSWTQTLWPPSFGPCRILWPPAHMVYPRFNNPTIPLLHHTNSCIHIFECTQVDVHILLLYIL